MALARRTRILDAATTCVRTRKVRGRTGAALALCGALGAAGGMVARAAGGAILDGFAAWYTLPVLAVVVSFAVIAGTVVTLHPDDLRAELALPAGTLAFIIGAGPWIAALLLKLVLPVAIVGVLGWFAWRALWACIWPPARRRALKHG